MKSKPSCLKRIQSLFLLVFANRLISLFKCDNAAYYNVTEDRICDKFPRGDQAASPSVSSHSILIVKPTRSKKFSDVTIKESFKYWKIFASIYCIGLWCIVVYPLISIRIIYWLTPQTVAPLAPTLRLSNDTGRPTIQITITSRTINRSHQVNSRYEGISSDDEDNDCKVFADVNDNTPMRNVTATGDSGGRR